MNNFWNLRRECVITLLSFAIGVGLPGEARATFHLWKIAEVYSNPSGIVQFVELVNSEDDETLLGGVTLSSAGKSFTFPSNLPPGTPTEGHRLLIATPGYAALAGVPAADYLFASNNFLNTAGDTLTFAGGLDALTFGNADLPKDGTNSLNRASPGAALVSAPVSPTNVGGTSGGISPWINQDNRFDVSGGNGFAPQDALFVINRLIRFGAHDLAAPSAGNTPPPFIDVNGSNSLSPTDAVLVINELIKHPPGAQPALARSALTPALPAAHWLAVPEPPGAVMALVSAMALLGWWAVGRFARGCFAAECQRPARGAGVADGAAG